MCNTKVNQLVFIYWVFKWDSAVFMIKYGYYILKIKKDIYRNSGSLAMCILTLNAISSQEESDLCDLERASGENISTRRISGWRISSGSAKDGQDTNLTKSSVQFSSVSQSCPTLCDPVNCSTPATPVHHQLLEFTQTHVHRVRDAIQPFHPLSSPSPPAPNPCRHQSLWQRVVVCNGKYLIVQQRQT